VTKLASQPRGSSTEPTRAAEGVYPRFRSNLSSIESREIYENFRTPLAETIDNINALQSWPDEWDGYQMAPSSGSIKHALSWIKDLYEDVSTMLYKDASQMDKVWLDPFVVADAHGNVVFEWWKNRRKLTVYVSSTTVEYIKVWGPNIFSDMEDGEVEVSTERQALWRWLTD
jgi:hypothetical protein